VQDLHDWRRRTGRTGEQTGQVQSVPRWRPGRRRARSWVSTPGPTAPAWR